MGAVLQKLGFGGDEGGGDAAVKRQAEGLSNPMYQLANLMGQVRHFLPWKIKVVHSRSHIKMEDHGVANPSSLMPYRPSSRPLSLCLYGLGEPKIDPFLFPCMEATCHDTTTHCLVEGILLALCVLVPA